ncbi:N-acetylmuramoyl-L-alanine amidase [Niallia sp.]|uniref:N-acetylmuramoyl-L-alanine amidase n=1 Tax=Niallia sp. TaxID=2837523 RepID=UPI00289FF34D|nr:N-acetylmuramoyl-L-alanine amidase [Niallia sp.]
MKNLRWMLLLLVSIFFFPTHNQLVSAENQLTVQANTVVNVRENPGLDQTVIGKMEIGKAYPLLKEEKDWIEIQYTSTSTGWVAAYLVTKNNQNTDTEPIEEGNSTSLSNKATITENGLRLRKGPGTNYQVITTLGKGIEVTILTTSGDWYQIKTSLGSGWVHNDYLLLEDSESPSSTTENQKESKQETAIVKEDLVNLRSNPSTSAEIIGKISIGTVITIMEEEDNWAKIQYSGNIGWIHKDLLESSDIESRKGQKTDKTIKLLYDRTNIRSDATVNSKVLLVANSGETFQAVEVLDDWYKIQLTNGDFGYIAEWIVEEDIVAENDTDAIANTSNSNDLKGKTIVIDPGHGGKDSGTIGVIGTFEKDLNLRTALLLANKLETAGAKVILTRKNDIFIPLQNRVDISHLYYADAFISLHYDSINDSSVNGVTSYYYTSNQKKLATSLHKSIIEATNRKDRGVRKSEFFVIKQNRQAASLLELGYLSNPAEEQILLSNKYQETISTAIYHGLENYFE